MHKQQNSTDIGGKFLQLNFFLSFSLSCFVCECLFCHCAAKNDHGLLIPLLAPPKSDGYTSVPPHLVDGGERDWTQASCILGKQFINWAHTVNPEIQIYSRLLRSLTILNPNCTIGPLGDFASTSGSHLNCMRCWGNT